MNVDRELGPTTPPFRRMRAARQLQATPDQITMGELLLALEREPVQPIRDQLTKVMQAKTENKSSPNNFVEKPSTASALGGEPNQELLKHLSDLIQHELAPSLGFLELAASDEIEDFTVSRTSQELASLRQRVHGLSCLANAHKPLVIESVSLDEFLHAVSVSHGIGEIVAIRKMDGSDSVVINTDRALLEMLVSNAFRNAREALSRLTPHRGSIEVTFSVDADGYWISIVNPFNGNEFSIDEVDRAGLSTKGLQRGYGVRIMRLISSRLCIAISLRGANGVAQLIIKKGNDFAKG